MYIVILSLHFFFLTFDWRTIILGKNIEHHCKKALGAHPIFIGAMRRGGVDIVGRLEVLAL